MGLSHVRLPDGDRATARDAMIHTLAWITILTAYFSILGWAAWAISSAVARTAILIWEWL